MKQHRTIWALTIALAVMTVLILQGREVTAPNSTVDSPGTAASANNPDVDVMIDLLRGDPVADKTATVDAIRRVAEQVESGKLKTAEGYFARGFDALLREDYNVSEAAYRKAIALRPDWSWPHNGLGILLGRYASNRVEDSEAAFRKAIALEPSWSRPHNGLAILLRWQGRLEDAEVEALKALELAPDSVAANNNYGNLLNRLGKRDAARQYYQRAIELDPDHPKPYYNLACLFSLEGDPDEAVATLEQCFLRDSSLRATAIHDEDFEPIRDDPRFRRLVDDKPGR